MTGTDRLAAFDTKTDQPVTIVFGTFNYREVIEKWIAAVHKLGYDGWRIVCMDRELIQWLEQRGDGVQAVDYYAVLPDAPRYDFGALSLKVRMDALMALRTRLFLHLARAGCDFLHSDADAFWMQDPRPYLAQHREYDLLMSQGISCPFEHYQRFGFVVCAGFFVCRANARTRAYFERIEALVNQQPLDQQRMNLVLQARSGRSLGNPPSGAAQVLSRKGYPASLSFPCHPMHGTTPGNYLTGNAQASFPSQTIFIPGSWRETSTMRTRSGNSLAHSGRSLGSPPTGAKQALSLSAPEINGHADIDGDFGKGARRRFDGEPAPDTSAVSSRANR